ncbi:MAG: NADH-quinone oxidoreductase subunit A [Planctomycetes bacterium]|nr:NADH-quinone oxidoreductase subunit A [Planctomycetota bacterium]
MTILTFFIVVFVGVGAFFLFVHLLMGKFIRPNRPEPDKMTIYECGEPTVGSAWIQFDLRYYVVALLFVIFDVEVAFFFPWAVVFGSANALSRPDLDAVSPKTSQVAKGTIRKEEQPQERRIALSRQVLVPSSYMKPVEGVTYSQLEKDGIAPGTAESFALFAFCDILVFFGVLMVGFAYLWKRGDINWVRSTSSERDLEKPLEKLPQPEHALAR